MVSPLLIGPLMIYHPISAASIARALANFGFRDEPGVFIQQYSELVAAIERAVKRGPQRVKITRSKSGVDLLELLIFRASLSV
jgi:hypothetical protein